MMVYSSPPWHRFLAAAGPDLHITDYGLGKVDKEIPSFINVPKDLHVHCQLDAQFLSYM